MGGKGGSRKGARRVGPRNSGGAVCTLERYNNDIVGTFVRRAATNAQENRLEKVASLSLYPCLCAVVFPPATEL